MKSAFSLAVIFLAAALPTVSRAADSLATASRPVITATRLAAPLDLDGKLDEQAWQNGHAVTEFKQRDPHEGQPASLPTEVRVLYDDDAIYIGARMHDTAPDSILARLTRRDVSIPADRFGVYVDPYLDRRSGYYFLVNAAGTLFDGSLYNDGWEDASWDGVWEGRAKVDDKGWTCEMRIPYSQMRFTDGERWGMNFRRVIQRRSEEDFVVYLPKKESGFVSRFPDLVGMSGIKPKRSIEVMPYLTSKGEFLRHAPDNPFNDGSRLVGDGGVDVRMGVGSKLTLNATVNPDFGQVEVDPAVVNLSDVESFFQEKRPFFVENAQVFRFGNEGADGYWGFNWPEPTFFYSRRVGRGTQGAMPFPGDSTDLPGGGRDVVQHTDRPIGTSILGAAKLTGKIAPSWNFGTLHALAARETGDLRAAGIDFEQAVEPLTYYGVLRTQKEFKDRFRGLGFMTNAAIRSIDDRALEDQLNQESIMAGLDGWTFLDKQKAWVISGWSALTHVRGTQARMSALQRSSRHYFQRPDVDHLGVDPNATSLTGFGSRYWLNHQKGNLLFNSAVGFMSPEFDVNDVGFMSYADLINYHVGGGYKWTEPTKHRKYQEALGAVFSSFDFAGNRTWGGVYASGNTEFQNNYSWSYWSAYNPRSISARKSRGGPLMINKPGYELGTYFDTDGKAKLFWYLEVGTYVVPEAGSFNHYVNPGIELKPVSNVLFSIGPGFSRTVEDAQYVAQFDDPTAVNTFGRRYVFAHLDQKTVSANIRLNWAFTPRVSLNTFLQPLISKGTYTSFKSLAQPRSYEFEPAAAPFNPDFNFKSLRGNAVFRWEYMPGSTLFLVWTQERTDDSDVEGNFRPGRSFTKLLDAQADNIFLAKVSYYFSL
jgi:hypothetical protein